MSKAVFEYTSAECKMATKAISVNLWIETIIANVLNHSLFGRKIAQKTNQHKSCIKG